MEIVLVGVLMLCIGMIIGMFMEEKIDKSYYLGMIDVVENSLKRHNESYDEYYKNNNKINDTAQKIHDRHSEAANIMKETTENIINKSVDLSDSKIILDEMDERLKKMDDDLESLK